MHFAPARSLCFSMFVCAVLIAEPNDGPDLACTDQPSVTAPSELEAGDLASSGACPGTGSCCVGHNGIGCYKTACCEAVCRVRPYCCTIGWTLECARVAVEWCDDTCAGACPSDGDCCEEHAVGGCRDELCCDLVCKHTPACCENGWTQACADLAGILCEVCDEGPVCPQPGDCCREHTPDGGCDRVFCCEIVCEDDSFCCDGEWDSICARKARENCPNICVCDTFGDFDGDAAVHLADFADLLTCYTGPGDGPLRAGCECADYDADDDSDLRDLAVFFPLVSP